jgi:lipopolysaccharide export LptBFGC system permease protein LptF
MTIAEAKKKIKELKKFNIDPVTLITEIHKKIALSFANLAFVLIALPLAIKTKKSSKSAGFGLSLAIIVFYYVLLAAGSALAIKEIVSPALGAWFANILVMTAGIILIYRTLEG